MGRRLVRAPLVLKSGTEHVPNPSPCPLHCRRGTCAEPKLSASHLRICPLLLRRLAGWRRRNPLPTLQKRSRPASESRYGSRPSEEDRVRFRQFGARFRAATCVYVARRLFDHLVSTRKQRGTKVRPSALAVRIYSHVELGRAFDRAGRRHGIPRSDLRRQDFERCEPPGCRGNRTNKETKWKAGRCCCSARVPR